MMVVALPLPPICAKLFLVDRLTKKKEERKSERNGEKEKKKGKKKMK
jgi:hypothetical protein